MPKRVAGQGKKSSTFLKYLSLKLTLLIFLKLFVGNYISQLMSCNVAVGVLLWFALPSFCFVIGLLQSEVIPSQDQGNTTTLALNITKPKFNSMYFALSLASYTTLSLERFAVLCSPVTLSVMFNGWKRISPKDGCLQLSRRHQVVEKAK